MCVAAVVLAAGFSRRFGSDKRLFPIAGEPMVARTVDLYVPIFTTTIVVVRPDDDTVRTLLSERPVRIVEAADAAAGMSRSLAAGVKAAADADYVVVALADMPYVRPETLIALEAAVETAPADAIVRPIHDGVPGHPVAFARRYFPALAKLTGDAGARDVVSENRGALVELSVDDPGVLRDVDAPDAA